MLSVQYKYPRAWQKFAQDDALARRHWCGEKQEPPPRGDGGSLRLHRRPAVRLIHCSLSGLVLYVSTSFVDNVMKKEKKTTFVLFFSQSSNSICPLSLLFVDYCIAMIIIIIHRTNLGLQTKM